MIRVALFAIKFIALRNMYRRMTRLLYYTRVNDRLCVYNNRQTVAKKYFGYGRRVGVSADNAPISSINQTVAIRYYHQKLYL